MSSAGAPRDTTGSISASRGDPTRVRFANQLRGLAAFGVVWHHLGVQYWSGNGFAAAMVGFAAPTVESAIPIWAVASKAIQAFGGLKARFDLGELSVALFFLISGFVIPMSLRRLAVREFAVARVLRIFPPYIASVCLLAFVSCVIAPILGGPGRADVPTLHWLAQALLVFDVFSTPLLDPVSWTLLIEIKFYIVCGCFATQIRKARVSELCLFFTIVALITALLQAPHVANAVSGSLGHGSAWQIRQLLSQLAYVSYLFCGYCFSIYWSKKVSLHKLIFSVAAFWLLSVLIFWLGNLPIAELRRLAMSQLFAIALFGGSMFMAASFGANRILDGLATISYPLYTTHLIVGWAVLSWCRLHGVASWTAQAISIGLALLVAWALHVTVEAPAVSVTKRLLNRSR